MSAGIVLLVIAGVLLWPGASHPAGGVRRGRRKERRSSAVGLTMEEIADTSVLLALALQSGRGLAQALEEVAEVVSPGAAEDLGRVGAALRWGRPMGEAWGYARAVWGPTATAFVVADAVGAPSAQVLLDAATTVRETESRRLEQAGGTAAVMLVLPLGLCFLPAFIATAVVPLVAVLVGTQLS